MRDFTNERLTATHWTIRGDGIHLHTASTGTLTGEEREALVAQLVARWNAVADALEALEYMAANDAADILRRSMGACWICNQHMPKPGHATCELCLGHNP